MKWLMLFAAVLFLLLSLDSMFGVYLIAWGLLTIHVEQPVYFSIKLLLYLLMCGGFLKISFLLFCKFLNFSKNRS